MTTADLIRAHTSAILLARAAYNTETRCQCGVELPHIADSHTITRRCAPCRTARKATYDQARYAAKKETL